MKKNLLFTLIAIIAIVANVYANGEATIMQTPIAPVIDGKLDDAVWDAIDEIEQDFVIWIKESDGAKREGNLEAASPFFWKACWDEDFLYVSIRIEDETITRDSPGVFVAPNDDGFDIPMGFVGEEETSNGNVTMVTVNVEPEKDEPIWTGDVGSGFLPTDALARDNGAEFANVMTDDGWNLEFKYPFAAFDVTVEDGTFMRFSPKYNDDNGNLEFATPDAATNKIGTDREEHTAWGAIAGGWKDPATYGGVTYSADLLEVKAVSVNELTKEFKVYPTHVQNTLNIDNYSGKATIFNVSGAQIQYINKVSNSIDVSTLNKGVYFIHTTSGVAKFVKL